MSQRLFTVQVPTGTFNNSSGETLAHAVWFDVAGTVDGYSVYGPTTPPVILPTLRLRQPTSAAAASTIAGSIKQFPATLTSNVWNDLLLTVPVAVAANTMYSVEEYTDYYCAKSTFWTAPLVTGNIHGPQDNTAPTGAGWNTRNGRFANSTVLGTYAPDNASNTFNQGCYFIDVLFTPAGSAFDATPFMPFFN